MIKEEGWNNQCFGLEWVKEYGQLKELSCVTNSFYIKENNVPVEDVISWPVPVL